MAANGREIFVGFSREPDNVDSIVCIIPKTKDRPDPVTDKPATAVVNEYYVLPQNATLDFKPITGDKIPEWMRQAGINGCITITPPITRVRQSNERYIQDHVTEINDFPPTGNRDGFFYEDGTARPLNLRELIQQCVQKYGWVMSAALIVKLNSLSSGKPTSTL